MGWPAHQFSAHLGVLALVLGACGPAPKSTAQVAHDTPKEAQLPAAEQSPSCELVPAPDTPAGLRLTHLVAAVNAEDASAVEDFVRDELSDEFLAAVPMDRHIQVIGSLRGGGSALSLCRVESSSDDEVVAILGGGDSEGGVEYARFFVMVAGEDMKIASLGIERATKEDLTRAAVQLDNEAVRQVVEDVASGLTDYVFADKAKAMQARIRDLAAKGDYAGITSPRKLAKRLTDDLRALTGDKHLHVSYSASVLPPPQPQHEMSPEEIERFTKQAAGDNFAMPVAEVRPGNVGYLLVLGFLPPEVAAEAVAETMSKLAGADALIIDLRQNGGGSPHGVALMTSYLFGSKRVHLNDIYFRSEDRTESFYTSPQAPGSHFGPAKPIYVLTSGRTFSAGEEFAYNLKALKRATIIGETTGGGAHPTQFVRVSDHWGVGLPSARSINPITKTNWEGVGVEPDVPVPSDQALDKALELAAKAMGAK